MTSERLTYTIVVLLFSLTIAMLTYQIHLLKHINHDLTTYIDAGCQGRYQGDGYQEPDDH